MNVFKRTIVFIGFSLALLLAFLLAFQSSEDTVQNIKLASEKTLFSENTTINSAFLQPEIITHVVINFKVNHQSIIKFSDSYLDLIPNLETSENTTASAFQDINRCAKVSLLLFPYHIFW